MESYTERRNVQKKLENMKFHIKLIIDSFLIILRINGELKLLKLQLPNFFSICLLYKNQFPIKKTNTLWSEYLSGTTQNISLWNWMLSKSNTF